MNPRLELYRSGTTMTVGYVVQRKTGRRVQVIDPARRTKAVIVGLLLGGKTPRQVARELDMPLGTVCVLGLAGLCGKNLAGRMKS